MPTLTVQRDTGGRDNIRKYRIFVDGVEVGQIWEGEALHLPITFGYHVVEAKIGWCGSRPLRFWPKSEHEVVRVRSRMGGWRYVLLGFFYALFNPRGWLSLELVR